MAGRNLTDDDVKALGKEIGAVIRGAGQAGGSGGAGGTPAKQNEFFETLKNKSMEALSPVAVFGKGLEGILGAVNAGKDTFRDLSKSGASFNNDIIGMTVAAAGTRLPLKDFAEVIKNNASELATLGAGVTRGAEAFARMSKSFMDSGAADSLKLLGYTNKDLNEVLALQAITLRGRFNDEKQRDAVAIESATKLATEMDLMAKLTGKSREAQAEQMKKAQMDMQFEAAIRLKTQGMSAEEAAKFEANARSQLRDAEIRGQGQMFKEVFATGQIMSKEAATQAALNQEQAAATTRQAKISADRTLESSDREAKAREAGREAQRAAVADMNNTAKLNMMALGDAGGVASQALNKSAADQITYTRGLENVARANNLDLKNKEDLIKAQKLLEEENKKSQAGQNAQGQQVDGATKAMIQFENRLQGVEAALTESLLKPLNEQIGPGLGKFANTYLSGDIGGRRDAEVLREAAARGRGEQAPARPQVGGLTGAAITAVEGTGAVYQAGLEAGKKTLGVVNQAGEPKKRSGGTIGMTGNLFEEMGSLVEITKPDETVMTSEQMKNMAKGMVDKGAEKALGGLRQLGSSAGPNFDISKLSDAFTTSFSGLKNLFSQPSAPKETKQKLSFDEFAGLDQAIAKMSNEIKTSLPFDKFGDAIAKMTQSSQANMPFDEFAGLDEAIAKQMPFDEFAGLDQAIAKMSQDIQSSLPIDEFGGLEEAIAKMSSESRSVVPFEFDGLEEAIARMSQDIQSSLPMDEFGGLEEAIAKQKSLTDMGEFAGVDEAIAKISQTLTQELPIDEFGSNFDDVIAKMSKSLTDSEAFDEFGSNFDDVIAQMSMDISDAIPVNFTKELAQFRIDEAKKAHDEAQAEVTALLNDANASDEEINSAYERYKETYDNLNKVVDESMSDLVESFDTFGDDWSDSVDKVSADISDALPFDEFAGLDQAIEEQKRMSVNTSGMDVVAEDGSVAQGVKINPETGERYYTDDTTNVAGTDSMMQDAVESASPTATGGFNLDSLSFGPGGKPVVKQIKSAAASIPAKKQPSPGKKINEETGEEYTPVEELAKQKAAEAKKTESSQSTTTKPGAGGKEASLNDVVTALNSLNTKMGQLITKTEDMMNKQINATKSNNNNIYARS